MAALIILFLLAQFGDGDALVLLILGIPAFLIIFYALWINISREYEPGPDTGDWSAIDEEE